MHRFDELRVVAIALPGRDPLDARVPPEPRQLPLCVLARSTGGDLDRGLQAPLPRQVARRLLVAMAGHRAQLRSEAGLMQPAHLVEQPALGEEPSRARVDAPIQDLARPIQRDQRHRSGVGRGPGRHSPASRLGSLQRAQHASRVAQVGPRRHRRVERLEARGERLQSVGLELRGQPLPFLRRPRLGTVVVPVDERRDVEPGAADDAPAAGRAR